MPIRNCPHCGEGERVTFAEDACGPVLWCQSCFHVTIGDAPSVHCPHFGESGCRRAETGDPDDLTPCVVCPKRAAGLM